DLLEVVDALSALPGQVGLAWRVVLLRPVLGGRTTAAPGGAQQQHHQDAAQAARPGRDGRAHEGPPRRHREGRCRPPDCRRRRALWQRKSGPPSRSWPPTAFPATHPARDPTGPTDPNRPHSSRGGPPVTRSGLALLAVVCFAPLPLRAADPPA